MNGARRTVWAAGAPLRWLLVAVIRGYQATLSGVMGGHCRFTPSCSHYGAEAIATRGVVVGVGLTTWRILRCNPYGKGGVDPVPPRRAYDANIHHPDHAVPTARWEARA
jgi:putative membrane protein insertion efficiency factor